MVFKQFQARGIGPELAAALPQNAPPWYKQTHLVKLNFSIFCLILFSSANGYDGSMMNGLQALPQWQTFMNTPTGAWLGFVNAVQSLGAFVCYPIVAWSNNRFGRKKTLGVGYLWLILGSALGTGAAGSTMFVLGRLFIGGTSAFYSASAPVLITETAYPTHRSIATALYNCGWYVAWVTFGTRNYQSDWAWRIPTLTQIAIPLVSLIGYIFAEESPRWLAAQGRVDEARAFLVKCHAGGEENSVLVDYELEEITSALALEKQAKENTSWLDMLRSKGNRHRTFISVTLGIFAQWNGVGIVSYYLAPVLKTIGITSVTSQTMISGFLQVWNLILAVSAAFSVDTLGRRKLFLISCCGMLATYVVISGLSGSFAFTGHAATGTAVIPFLFIFYGFYDIAFTPLIVSYTCEIWPYELRARGLSLTLTVTQLAIFFNIFVNPIALEAIQWKYYIVYCIILVCITITVWFCYPETNGHSLEEMARIFDGDEATNVLKEGSVQEAVAGRRGSLVEQDLKNKDIMHVEKL